MSIEDGRKRQQAKQAPAEKQQTPAQPLDLEALRTIIHEAVKEVIQGEIDTLREAMRQAVGEVAQAPAAQQNQELSAELGAIDAQLETIRFELQFIRTAIDLQVKASQAQALANEALTCQPEEATAATKAEEAEDNDAALPLFRDISLPRQGRDAGPAPIDLLAPRQGVKS